MKRVSLLLLVLTFISCGKEQTSKKNVSYDQPEREDRTIFDNDNTMCTLNERKVPCDTIQGADGQGVDLLESMIEVEIKIDDPYITFLSDKEFLASGRRINCHTRVKAQENLRFTLNQDELTLQGAIGRFKFKRLSEGDGIIGAWVWRGYEDQGKHVTRVVTFLGQDRLIMRTSCEL